MSRNRMATELQKTYDDSYLSCSTAVFYEGQGNEAEATRYWKNALDRICDYHKTQPYPIAQGDQAQVEQSLFKAIKELEYQCRERIDILEALRASRQDDPGDFSGIQSTNSIEGDSVASTPGSKFIGQGTIPAVTYSELSRPRLSHRQSPLPRRSSESSRVSLHRTSIDANARHASSQGTRSHSNTPRPGKSSRPSSPEKHSMRTTLRSGKAIEKCRPSPQTPRANGEGSSKAATLAWNTFGSRDSAYQSSPQDAPSSSNSTLRQLAEQFVKARKSPPGGDDRLRKHVSNGEADTLTAKTRQPADWSSSQPSLLSISAASNALGSSANSEPSMPDKTQAPPGRSTTSSLFAAYSASPRTPRGEPAASSSDNNLAACQEKPNDLNTPSGRGSARNRASRSGPLDSSTLQQIRYRCDQCTKPHSSPKVRAIDGMHISPSPHRRSSESRKYSLSARRDQGGEDGGEEGLDEEERRKSEEAPSQTSWTRQKAQILRSLPPGVDEDAARQILNDIVVQGDEVHWRDIAGLEVAKNALREAVVYPFLRPDLFMGLREPARGMLLFGPPGTGKTMLARAVATESRSTFFSISASSLTSKYLGESEKLVRALFSLARALAPSIIFVDEIDSLLSQRSGSGEHEATRRIKTEFLIQWSDLQRAAAGREVTEKDRERGDANRVLVLAATNMPWAIDEAARRRFVRRQYIPLPEATTRQTQLGTLLGQQKHDLSAADLDRLVELTDGTGYYGVNHLCLIPGFSGSDITALAKDAAMGPLRSLGEALLHMTMDDIRPIQFIDFESSLATIRPSVSKRGLEQYEDWAKEFGERGG